MSCCLVRSCFECKVNLKEAFTGKLKNFEMFGVVYSLNWCLPWAPKNFRCVFVFVCVWERNIRIQRDGHDVIKLHRECVVYVVMCYTWRKHTRWSVTIVPIAFIAIVYIWAVTSHTHAHTMCAFSLWHSLDSLTCTYQMVCSKGARESILQKIINLTMDCIVGFSRFRFKRYNNKIFKTKLWC